MTGLRAILLPGNGGGGPDDNWFPYLQEELPRIGIEVVASEFPDNILARSAYWLPFIKDELKADENSILIGHSSGAIAAMRFAEDNRIYGSILVGTYHSDLGIEAEKISGYFDKPWNWKAIANNQNWVAIYASTDDPWIPIAEPRVVAQSLNAEYFEYKDRGHFGGDYLKTEFPEIVSFLAGKVAVL